MSLNDPTSAPQGQPGQPQPIPGYPNGQLPPPAAPAYGQPGAAPAYGQPAAAPAYGQQPQAPYGQQPYPAPAPTVYPADAYQPAPVKRSTPQFVVGIILTVLGGLLTLSVLVSLTRPQPATGLEGQPGYAAGLLIGRLIPVVMLIIGIVLIVCSRRR